MKTKKIHVIRLTDAEYLRLDEILTQMYGDQYECNRFSTSTQGVNGLADALSRGIIERVPIKPL